MPPYAPKKLYSPLAKIETRSILNVIPFDRVLQSDTQYYLCRFLVVNPERRAKLEAGAEYFCHGGISIPIILDYNHGQLPGFPTKTAVVQCHPVDVSRQGPILILVREELLAMPVVLHPDLDYVGTPETTEWFSLPSDFLAPRSAVGYNWMWKGRGDEDDDKSEDEQPPSEPTTDLMNMKQQEVSDDKEDDETECVVTWPLHELRRIAAGRME
ncbi:hypothetical protein FB451DRAFT_1183701 [Mycena latifolia]|nr:hypothetical protein FB451DRAFT_1183701 [Mycena latifolia]